MADEDHTRTASRTSGKKRRDTSLAKTDVSRLEAFSDGVFAVAITLLILEIKVPQLATTKAASADLFHALSGQWPSLIAYVISFISILIMWVNHHEVFGLIRRVSRGILFANGILLLLITFVPFPTAVLARYMNTTAAPAAAAFYCGSFVLVNIGYNLLWFVARTSRESLKEDMSDEQIRKISRSYLSALPVYLSATALALWHPFVGLALFLLPWTIWARLRYTSKEEKIV